MVAGFKQEINARTNHGKKEEKKVVGWKKKTNP